jgi:hypothetical protein
VKALLAPIKEISKIQHLDIKPKTELVGEEIRTAKLHINIGPLVSM